MGSARTTAQRIMLSVTLLLSFSVAAGCVNAPPPQVVPNDKDSAPKVIDPTEVVVGVDQLTRGFNPHALADQSSVTNTLAMLILPSAFRDGPDGTPQPDPAIINSAQVTKSEPFTVTYTLRRDASWSDGAPIAAEDFDYLWRHVSTEPGTVNPAGYRLISNVISKDSGKTVEVVFRKPYPGWRSLFRNLLPAHLLKDAPSGWVGALDTSFPASGGRFSIRSIDLPRGEVSLERNDRYWGTPAALSRIVLRRTDSTGLVNALRSGNDQLALVSPNAAGMEQFAALGKDFELTTLPRATVVQLLLRPSSPVMADVRMRTALLSLLDRKALIAAGTGNGPAEKLRADAQLFGPTQPAYKSTLPADNPAQQRDIRRAETLLTQLGYVRNEAGRWSREGRPLTLTIGAAADREPYALLAHQVQKQLAEHGISARVVNSGGDQLFGELLPSTPPLTTPSTSGTNTPNESGVVDLAVIPQIINGDPATVLASSFGCAAQETETPTTPVNPANFCDRTLQPVIDSALTGAAPLAQVLPGIETSLWQQVVVVPLFQLADVWIAGKGVAQVDLGPTFVGPFSSANRWQRLVK